MKILYACPAYKPAFRMGGSVHSVSSTAEAMAARGHDVTVFTTNSNLDEDLDVPVNQPVEFNGVKVWYFKREEIVKKYLPGIPYLAQSAGLGYAPELKGALARLVPTVDIVHTQLPFNYPTVATGSAARKLGKPLFFNQRGDFDARRLAYRALKKKLFLRWFEMPNLRYATGLVALTRHEEASFRALGLTNPVHVIPNGIDVAKFRQQATPEVDAEFGIPPSAQVVLFLGRLHSVKGADKLLEAFISVQGAIPNAVLVMAGPDEHQIEAQSKELVESAGLKHRVLFPGAVSGDRKANLLARADLFCLPSDAEGFSMAVLEAMASRTALLLSPGCYFPESEAAGASMVVEPTVENLGRSLVELLSAPPHLAEMADRALELVRRNYTWDSVADKLLAAYEDALASGRTRSR
jgi:glycosyltransferase involved in cell wall biosynthesis